jgi:Ice-binding-like
MARSAGLPRRAVRLAVVPLAVLLAAACGGSDFVDFLDGSTSDGPVPDGSVPDGSNEDATLLDSGSQDADASSQDADGGRFDGDAGSKDGDAGILDLDTSFLDVGLDTSFLDVGLDTSLLDVGLDTSLLDVGLDTSFLDADSALDGDGPLEADSALDGEAGVFDSGTSGLLQSLGTAAPFVVLGGATVTNSDVGVSKTVLIGDVGTTGPTIVGLTGPPNQPSGNTDINDARAGKALLDVGTAYTALAGEACPPANALTGMDLGGLTLAPGVYCFTSAANQASATTLTFDAKGDPNAVWVIQVATQLTVMDHATAVIIGGPPSLACRIFWAMGTAAVINNNTQFLGNVISSSQTVMMADSSLVPGRAFGITAGVTLLSDSISAAACP